MTIHSLSLTQYSEYVSSGFETLSLEHHLFEYVGEPLEGRSQLFTASTFSII
ncbi:hypothetical protein DKAM_0942 [Desulfurococcus amylolyticus 1221n]|uniref:Uncharacterized protein n=1 Tax=Desulfurococcus amylolyticus (strain DSM 18924 / JCM 16383 / VKM B-2413 / 1221n) TaxID=490899 RepID=B8D587_DESA1|nr:hypothetical protein DKAM_0942 [Desulfurococcus amylolyticus 1221n]